MTIDREAGVRTVPAAEVRPGMRIDLGAMFTGNPLAVRDVGRRPEGLIAIHFEWGCNLQRPDAPMRVVAD